MDERLNGAAPPGGAPPPAVVANGHDPALIAEARRLVETTILSQAAIGAKLGLRPQAISDMKRDGGWVRPEGAPGAPRVLRGGLQASEREAAIAAKREQLVIRLYRACDRQLALVERKLRKPRIEVDERDVRTLGLLARTLGTLMALDRDDGATSKDAEPVDRDKLNAELARRIARWAEGREEPD